MKLDLEARLENLLQYDEKLFELEPADLRAISDAWAEICVNAVGKMQVAALRQTLLYNLQLEISQGKRNALEL